MTRVVVVCRAANAKQEDKFWYNTKRVESLMLNDAVSVVYYMYNHVGKYYIYRVSQGLHTYRGLTMPVLSIVLASLSSAILKYFAYSKTAIEQAEKLKTDEQYRH